MKREQRHMPCQFKVDRTRASYTRIHKALAWLRDAAGTPQFDAMLAGSGRALKHVKPCMSLMVRRAVPGKYVVVVTEHGEKLHEVAGEDLRGLVDKLFWKTLDDETLDLARVSGVSAEKSRWESMEGRHARITVEGDDPAHGPFRIPVDVDIAPLVVKLNMAGIRTRYSCQGDPGKPLSAYVALDPSDDNETARRIVLGFWHDRYVYYSAGRHAYYMSDTDAGRQRLGPPGDDAGCVEPLHRPDKPSPGASTQEPGEQYGQRPASRTD